jgi:hypothetical protein
LIIRKIGDEPLIYVAQYYLPLFNLQRRRFEFPSLFRLRLIYQSLGQPCSVIIRIANHKSRYKDGRKASWAGKKKDPVPCRVMPPLHSLRYCFGLWCYLSTIQ